MKIEIACVGKVKEKFFREAIEEYSKRLGRYVKLEISEVADEKTPEGASEAEEEKIRVLEGERLLKKIPDGAYMIALAIEGQSLTSPELAEKLSSLAVSGKSHIVFVIGGSLGLSGELMARADMALSFSAFTYPHQLMRVILLEQIYRSYRIINHEPYHK